MLQLHFRWHPLELLDIKLAKVTLNLAAILICCSIKLYTAIWMKCSSNEVRLFHFVQTREVPTREVGTFLLDIFASTFLS